MRRGISVPWLLLLLFAGVFVNVSIAKSLSSSKSSLEEKEPDSLPQELEEKDALHHHHISQRSLSTPQNEQSTVEEAISPRTPVAASKT